MDALFVPVGGGGLIAGVAAYVKYVWPQTRIIGVEPEDAACLQLALTRGRRDTLAEVGLFADGCAVAQVGKEPFKVAREYVDEADRKYSFHWQATDGELIIRWDNAPHHPELSTHPDHKHIGETVEMAGEVSLDEVLSRIEERIGVEE